MRQRSYGIRPLQWSICLPADVQLSYSWMPRSRRQSGKNRPASLTLNAENAATFRAEWAANCRRGQAEIRFHQLPEDSDAPGPARQETCTPASRRANWPATIAPTWRNSRNSRQAIFRVAVSDVLPAEVERISRYDWLNYSGIQPAARKVGCRSIVRTEERPAEQRRTDGSSIDAVLSNRRRDREGVSEPA